jgi:hypothetical protein
MRLPAPSTLSRVRLVAAAVCFSAGRLAATSVLLSNDGYPTGGATFQAGFFSGEMAASTLGPVAVPSLLDRVELLYGPVDDPGNAIVRVYPDTGVAVPGTEIFSATVELAPADATILRIELAGAAILVPAGDFRVAIEFDHDGAPSVAADGDGTILGSRNWIYSTGSWISSQTAGLDGDWIIRAVITVPPELFTDGFETGDYVRWADVVGGA